MTSGKLNWTYIVKDALHPVVIVYLRTNIVKAAISGELLYPQSFLFSHSNALVVIHSAYRGQLTHALCEASNLRGDQITCPIPSQVNWTLSEFIENVNYWQVRILAHESIY